MPKGQGYKTPRTIYDDNAQAVNRNDSTPHQKTIVIQRQPKAAGMGKVTRIGITSLGNCRTGAKSTKY